jgi:hypothetical protein
LWAAARVLQAGKPFRSCRIGVTANLIWRNSPISAQMRAHSISLARRVPVELLADPAFMAVALLGVCMLGICR